MSNGLDLLKEEVKKSTSTEITKSYEDFKNSIRKYITEAIVQKYNHIIFTTNPEASNLNYHYGGFIDSNPINEYKVKEFHVGMNIEIALQELDIPYQPVTNKTLQVNLQD